MYNYTANRYSLDPPPFLQSEYKYATNRLEQELPLPGNSVKVPFEEKPARFLNLNRKKYEIDYLKSQIEHKVQMEELHYQARLQQMRKQNQLNRYRVEQMMKQHPDRNLFAAPQEVADDDTVSISNLSNLSIRDLYRKKQKMYTDSIDKVKQKGSTSRSFTERNHRDSRYDKKSRPSTIFEEGLSDQSNDTQKKYKQKQKRQAELDYIYKRREAPKQEKGNQNFSIDVPKKKDPEDDDEEKRREYEWVRQVRKARGLPVFVEERPPSSDSSSITSKSSSKSSESKQSTQKKSKGNIFNRRESSSEDERKSKLRTQNMRKHNNPESQYPPKERYVDKYQASERSSVRNRLSNRSNWRH